METLLELIENKYNEHEQALTDIYSQYKDSELYSTEDTSMIDYHEGAVEALSIILYKAKEIYGLTNDTTLR